jgi:hypothetical protein
MFDIYDDDHKMSYTRNRKYPLFFCFSLVNLHRQNASMIDDEHG